MLCCLVLMLAFSARGQGGLTAGGRPSDPGPAVASIKALDEKLGRVAHGYRFLAQRIRQREKGALESFHLSLKLRPYDLFTASTAVAANTLKTLPRESSELVVLLTTITVMGLQEPSFAHLTEPLIGSLFVLAGMYVGAEVLGQLLLERVDQLLRGRMSFDEIYLVLFELRSGRRSSNLSLREMRKVLDHQSSELLRLRRQILMGWGDFSPEERHWVALSYLEAQATHLEDVQFALFISSESYPSYSNSVRGMKDRCFRSLLRHAPSELPPLGF